MESPTPFEVSDRLVDDLAALDPILATTAGVAGHDHEWTDLSPAGHDLRAEVLRGHRQSLLPGLRLADRRQRMAARVLVAWIDGELAAHEAGDHLRDLSHMNCSFESMREVLDLQDRSSSEGRQALRARLASVGTLLEGLWQSLALGLERGIVQPRRQITSVIEQADALAGPGTAWRRFVAEAEGAAPGESEQLGAAVEHARAAVGRFAERLREDYLPRAPERDGVGRERYLRQVDRHLGLDLDPLEVYDWGWEEIGRLRSELERVGREIGPGSIEAVTDLLETDPDRAAASPEELVAFVAERQGLALDALAGSHFDVPRQIRRVAVLVAPPGGALGAYYHQPSEDFTRPGTIWYSLADRRPFPLYQEVSTAYHEGFPGHHLQIGTSVVNADRLSRAHRLLIWYAGYGEGWALYAERLMDELGFLERPDYVFGMLAGHMFRAARVVVDIGLHLGLRLPDTAPLHAGRRWDFDRAVDVMHRMGMQPVPYAVSEVTRYLGWPGQAISYKIGEREILTLRDELRRRRGPDFSLAEFHTRVLGEGIMRLDLLRDVVVAP